MAVLTDSLCVQTLVLSPWTNWASKYDLEPRADEQSVGFGLLMLAAEC